MTKKTNIDHCQNLINSLCDELEPRKPLSHPFLRMLPWVVLTIIYMAFIASVVIGLRDNWQAHLMNNTLFQLDILFASFLALSSSFVLGWVNLPDLRQQPKIVMIPLVALGVFALYIGWRLISADYSGFAYNLDCFQDALFLVVLPVAALVFLLRKGCPSCHKQSAFFATLAVSSMGWIGLRFTCNVEHVAQNFVLQFLPFVILGFVLGALSDRLFRW